MTKIASENISPGMVVKEDVEDRNGRVLLPRGSVIEKHHVKIFKMWGVYEVDVVFDDKISSINTFENIEDIRKINPRFLKANIENPCIIELFRFTSSEFKTKLSDYLVISDSKLEEMINNSEFKKMKSAEAFFNEDTELFTLPAVFTKLTATINNPNSSALDISRVVEKDPGLSARTLKLVNSPFYGFSESIDTIYNAVIVLGTKQLSMLAMGLSMMNVFNGKITKYFNMDNLWKHCLGVGICSKIIAKHIEYKDHQKIFVAGILHDIGKLVMMKQAPVETAMSAKYSWNKNIFTSEAEREMFGFDHGELGKIVCFNWQLPEIFSDIVNYHHYPSKSDYPLECSIVHLAEVIVNAMEFGASGEKMILPLNDFAWKIINISENAIPIIINQLKVELDITVQLLN